MLNVKTYTQYSLKHSIASLDKIVEKAIEDKDTHLAVLDKGELHSLIYLQKVCNEHNINPIIGYEFSNSVTLWPMNNDALQRLSRILLEETKTKGLKTYSQYADIKDIIAITSAQSELNGLVSHFGHQNVYLEYRYGEYNIAKQIFDNVLPANDVLYNEKKDALGHDYFINYLWKDDRHYASDDFYIKQFKDVSLTKDEVLSLEKFSKRFSINIELGKLRLPAYDRVPAGKTSSQYLEELCLNELKNRQLPQEYLDRLNHELSDIKEAGLDSYFLIVKDICDFAKQRGIQKGKGRGSGAGSLVCYLLNITGIDPIKHNLIWERFYNAGRKGSLPDIDTDFEAERREEIIQYISERFGHDKVFHIITFGSLGPKKAIKSIMSMAGCSFEEQNEITNHIWHKATSITEALEHSEKLREEMSKRKAILNIAKQLEGSYESFGKHAAGIVITNESYASGNIPMTWHADDEEYISAYDLDAIDAIGLLKIDILGLNTLNIIKDTVDLINKRYPNLQFKIENIPYDDKDTYEQIFHTGKTKCVFQLESQIGQKYSELVKPNNIDEVADVTTLIRPGAMVPGQTQKYIDVRNGASPNYPHIDLKDVLDDTYGACIYQEQIIKLCQKFAGMDLKKADSVRAAAGKKKKKLMESLKNEFIDGCIRQKYTKELAELLWSWIIEFSGYSFNASHAVSYAYAAYETAYLKQHFPIEFFTANLNRVVGDIHRSEFDKISEIVNDAKLFNIAVIAPSVKYGNSLFSIKDDKTIIYGLDRIKGIGASSIPLIIECGKANSYDQFLHDALNKGLRKDIIEALIMSGALDCYKVTRNQMAADFNLLSELTDREFDDILTSLAKSVPLAIKEMIDENNIVNRKQLGKVVPNIRRRNKLNALLVEYSQKDKYETILHIARYEKEYLGCPLSVSETDGIFASITHQCLEIKTLPPKTKTKISIVLNKVKEIETKKGKNPGQKMAFLTGGDASYELNNIVVFPQPYEKFKSLLKEGSVLFLDGITSENGGLIANRIVLLK